MIGKDETSGMEFHTQIEEMFEYGDQKATVSMTNCQFPRPPYCLCVNIIHVHFKLFFNTSILINLHAFLCISCFFFNFTMQSVS